MKHLFPTVTCILQTTGRLTLRRALASVTTQTRQDVQVLVVDSGHGFEQSAWNNLDELMEREKTYSAYKDHPMTDWIFTGEPKNLKEIACPTSKVMNEVIRQGLIKGEYFCMHYDDDVYYPQFMEKMARYLDDNPKCLAVRCTQDRVKVYPDGREEPTPQLVADKIITKDDGFDCVVDGQQAMMRTSVLSKLSSNWFDEDPDWNKCSHSDGLFFEKTKPYFKEMHFINEALCQHRATPHSTYTPTK